MQTPQEILDTYFLDTRHELLEIAATLDRYDRAVEQANAKPVSNDPRRQRIQEALDILAGTQHGDRAEMLLNLFSEE